ncbi:MAG: hypothetical protein OQK32_04000 [Gammaproteobacteria bacterium]|nr:hypothetical protein [Gammaproteobacteria bacterium]MCW8923686.1 hypothetical protein [Gammaproteobacteria bacterium]
MPGTMSQADLIADLKGILNDAQDKFKAADDADFIRHLDVAARDMGRVRRRTRIGTIVLVADQPNYAAPADILFPKYPIWGLQQRNNRKPWQSNYPGRAPTMQLIDGESSEEIYLQPAPSAAAITDLGSEFKYYYFAFHTIGDAAEDTTIKLADRDLLLLRATAQAMTELAHHNVTKPIKMGGQGIGLMPKNGTPSALAKDLMDLFERMAA